MNRKWTLNFRLGKSYILYGLIFAILALLIFLSTRSIHGVFQVFPGSTMEINWREDGQMNIGGSYKDEDEDGIIEIILPNDTRILATGRSFEDGFIFTRVSNSQAQLSEAIPATLSILKANDSETMLISAYSLDSAGTMDEANRNEEVNVIDGFSESINKASIRYFSADEEQHLTWQTVSILDDDTLENSPSFTGEATILGKDHLEVTYEPTSLQWILIIAMVLLSICFIVLGIRGVYLKHKATTPHPSTQNSPANKA